MQRLVLYNAPQSTCSQRVLFVLQEKGLEFTERTLDLFSRDHLRPRYLKINRVSDPTALVPNDPVKRAAMRSFIRYTDEVPTPTVRVLSYNMAFLPHFSDMSEDDFVALAESKPLRKDFLLSMGRTGFSTQEMPKRWSAYAKRLCECLKLYPPVAARG